MKTVKLLRIVRKYAEAAHRSSMPSGPAGDGYSVTDAQEIPPLTIIWEKDEGLVNRQPL